MITEISKSGTEYMTNNYELVFIYVEFRMTVDLQVTGDGCSLEDARQICEFSI